jgi:hypothetical protein
VIGPGEQSAPGDRLAVEAVVELVSAGASRRHAAEVVARLTRGSRKRLYDASL